MTGGIINTGLRVILAVDSIHSETQATVFYGKNLFQQTGSPWGVGSVDIGSISEEGLFRMFLKPFINKSREWAELEEVPYNPLYYSGRQYFMTPPEIHDPIASQQLMLLNLGNDTKRGYWLRFKGNKTVISLFKGITNMTGGPADYGIKIS